MTGCQLHYNWDKSMPTVIWMNHILMSLTILVCQSHCELYHSTASCYSNSTYTTIGIVCEEVNNWSRDCHNLSELVF